MLLVYSSVPCVRTQGYSMASHVESHTLCALFIFTYVYRHSFLIIHTRKLPCRPRFGIQTPMVARRSWITRAQPSSFSSQGKRNSPSGAITGRLPLSLFLFCKKPSPQAMINLIPVFAHHEKTYIKARSLPGQSEARPPPH